MTDFLLLVLPWIISTGLLLKAIFLGNKYKWVWLYAIALQAVWFTWAVLSHEWGFIPAVIGMIAINIRNHFKWNGED